MYIGSGKSFEAACRLKDAAERICFGKFRRQEEFPVVEGWCPEFLNRYRSWNEDRPFSSSAAISPSRINRVRPATTSGHLRRSGST